jgi:hypothetical protein
MPKLERSFCLLQHYWRARREGKEVLLSMLLRREEEVEALEEATGTSTP